MFSKLKSILTVTTLLVLLAIISQNSSAQTIDVSKKLKGFDQTIEKILKDWNVPGCGIGIVVKDTLVFAKGYGYRDLENKLPVTPNTLFQIASNTKLFTATAVGFLVEEGKLDWDKPIKNYVPQIQFYNDELNANVTIRDMLSHRTGISRHDAIWYKSDFTRQELFDRIKYLEPSIPFRQGSLYNNLMYAAAGQIVEYLSGQTWEEFVKSKIFSPLNMSHSMFVVEEMMREPDFMTPYYEKRDTSILLPYPFYTQQQGVGPCGSIISNINDLSNWLIAQMHNGRFKNNQVIPASIIKETMTPAIPTASVPDKYFENLNSIYGMGRSTSSYKGHYLTQHGGAIGGIYSNISFMPADSIGVIVFTNRLSQLTGIITYTVYDKLLGLEETPWSERSLTDYLKSKETSRESRKKPDTDRVPNTKPSHPLADYAGIYEDPAYGMMIIDFKNDSLNFTFNHVTLPLYHYHYDRFITPDDQINGKWSMTFNTDAQGSISQVKVSLDEKEVTFTRKADPRLRDPEFLKTLEGQYELNGTIINLVFRNNELILATAPPQHLEPYKNNMFRIREFSDYIVEFIFDDKGIPTGAKYTAEGNSVLLTKKK
ncbi:MAG: serine hydrolase [Bacteroidetes bacterium]|nr:serine hydrolase [Bacteroidota bacterium]